MLVSMISYTNYSQCTAHPGYLMPANLYAGVHWWIL